MRNPFKPKSAPPPSGTPRPSGRCGCCGDNLRDGRCPMCTGAVDGVACECQTL